MTEDKMRNIESLTKSLLKELGEDPKREGLKSTPARVIKAFKEYFGGYNENPSDYLAKTFKEVDVYDCSLSNIFPKSSVRIELPG